MLLFKKIAIAGGALFGFSLLMFIIFPPFLRSQVKKAVQLKQGANMRTMWEKLPFPLDFKIYLFNVTNPDEIKTGAKPIVREVGPFFYDEWKEKVECEDREEDDTVEYKNKATWIFNPDKSAPGLTEDVEIMFPHIMILGIVLSVVRDKPGMVGVAAKAVDSIFHKPDSVFIKTTARQIIWDGLPIDCSVKDFPGNAVCTLLRESDGGLIKDGPDGYRIALFGHKNGTIVPDRLRVIRGIKNATEVGVVTELNGEPKLNVWSEEGTCNEFNGTDSTIFHPYLYAHEDVVSFTPDLCRSMGAKYERPSPAVIGGLKTNRYTADLGDMSNDPEIKCLCPTPDTCLKKGLFDLFNCVKAPIVASLPHFYLADEAYLTQVDGLHPSKEEHEILIDFEPMTGTPVQAAKRLQFNMFIFPIEKFKLMKTFPTALLPIFWIEEGVLLPKNILSRVKMVFTVMSVVKIMKWLMLVTGMGLGGAAGGLFYKAQQAAQKLDITKISPKVAPNANGQEKKWPNSNVSTIHGSNTPIEG